MLKHKDAFHVTPHPAFFDKVIVVRGQKESWKHKAKVQRIFLKSTTVFVAFYKRAILEPNAFSIHHRGNHVSPRFRFVYVVLIMIQQYFTIRMWHLEEGRATSVEFKQVSHFMTESALSGTSKPLSFSSGKGSSYSQAK